METLKHILEYKLLQTDSFLLTTYDLLAVILLLIFARLLLWLFKKLLSRKSADKKIDDGKQYTIYQITKYFVYVITIAIALETIGIKLTVILAGSAALFVGLGLGLQSLFNDLASGIIILSERTLAVNDIIEVDGIVGKVREVGLRTTKVLTREDIVMIIPNHKFVSENVINWSQNRKDTLFTIPIGVAYGSDTDLVQRLLIECAKEHPAVAKNPKVHVFFTGFGESSLDFELRFHSTSLFRIEKVKSELRFRIDKKFREHKVTIPFPQRDLYIKEIPKDKAQKTDKTNH